MLDKIIIKIVNSNLYFNLYYRWTKQHKHDCAETRKRVLKRKIEILNMNKQKEI